MRNKIIGVDINKCLNNNNALISTLITPKGDRKTTAIKNQMFDDFIHFGEQSLYLRRFKTQVTTNVNDFYGEIIPHYPERYDGWQFRKSKHTIEASKDGKTWDIVCYVYALSQVDTIKSQINITNLHRIYYDEVIPMDNRYLKNEPKYILEIWKTVDRDRILNPEIKQTKMLLCGNAITPSNPFYDFWHVDIMQLHNGFNYFNNGQFCAIKLVNKGNQRLRQQSRFDMLVNGTGFEEYEHGGNLNNVTYQQMLPTQAQPYCNIIESGKRGTVYLRNNNLIFSERVVETGTTVTIEDVSDNVGETINLKYSPLRAYFKAVKAHNGIYFHNINSFNAFKKTFLYI